MNENTTERAVYRIIIDAPIEDIWSELIDTNSPRPFFFNARCETPEVKPGQPYRMVSKNGKNVAVVGETLEMDPPHRLVQSFRFVSPTCKIRPAGSSMPCRRLPAASNSNSLPKTCRPVRRRKSPWPKGASSLRKTSRRGWRPASRPSAAG